GAPSKYDSYTKIFGNSLLALMKKDKTIAAITAAMPSGTGLDKVAEQLPDAVFDVGIAEQHAVTFAAGMATRGGKPFVAIYSTFLQRAFDQVVHDVAVQNLPVRFVLDRAGFVGADGATHHGAFDLAYLCPLPHFVIMAPKDGPELTAMLDFMANHNKGPIAIRFPRGEAAMLEQTTHMELKKMSPISLGKAELLLAAKEQENQPSNGRNNIALWALGSMVEKTWRAIALLRQQGQHELADNLTLINARFAKPLDRGLIKKLAANHRLFITLEEGSIGGFYSQMANALQAMALTAGVNENGIALQGRYFPDHFIEQASVYSQLTEAQLSPETIANFILASHSAIKNKL
ncbi:MAG: 1-deoxy-D-xylulose-5-phosphate synthase, partial [Alphaproteobacteria bacterium]|nr:1-deoxy-D-xylulose-5-phosphate synthase [Alphaproteobacteria bacterium]